MFGSKIAMRYATSLLESSLSKNNLGIVSSDMDKVISIFDANPALIRVLDNPVIKPEKKQSILTEIFGNIISEDSLNFLLFVIRKNRDQMLADILRSFQHLRDQHYRIVNLKVKSAYELDENERGKIISRFEEVLNKKVRAEFQSDPSIIGGFIAQVDDTVYDASIKHQLIILKSKFLSEGVSLN
ncbi:MAG: ATP synthase F1 subunit delta [Ignavibacteriaceae bacterium]